MLLDDRPLSYIARSVGFQGENAESNFIRAFKNLFNETPASWAKNHKKRNNRRMLV
jgi:AraC-like DNA-binding protein